MLRIGTGRSSRCMRSTAIGISATNGGRPASSSYRTQPNEYRSERPSTSMPMVCSGDMYNGEPMV